MITEKRQRRPRAGTEKRVTCPTCGGGPVYVYESRPKAATDDPSPLRLSAGWYVWRRRKCEACHACFTTMETVVAEPEDLSWIGGDLASD